MKNFEHKRAVMLDMNGTFMFGEDRFGPEQNYFDYYQLLGGQLPRPTVNSIVNSAYAYLDERYPDPRYRETFPSVLDAIRATRNVRVDAEEEQRLVETFAAHEIGTIDSEYADALHHLNAKFLLGAVIDIWAPKAKWTALFEHIGIDQVFSSIAFSSDHGIVKPSPKPFTRVLNELGVSAADAIFVGDSVRRDLGGATSAGIECVLVGGAKHRDAVACAPTLLDVIGG